MARIQGLGPVKDPHDELVAHQYAPAFYRPVWHVGHLVYQGGIPRLKRSSMTGGGFIPAGRQLTVGLPTRGHESPSWQPYATPVSSISGSGITPSRPNFLTRLFGGMLGRNQ
jgi:hypothetical protein